MNSILGGTFDVLDRAERCSIVDALEGRIQWVPTTGLGEHHEQREQQKPLLILKIQRSSSKDISSPRKLIQGLKAEVSKAGIAQIILTT